MFRWTSSCSRSIWTEQLSSYHAELCLPPSLLPSPFFAAEQVSQVQPCVSGLFVKCWRSYSHRITVEKDKKREWEFLWTCILSIKQQVTLRTVVSTKNCFWIRIKWFRGRLDDMKAIAYLSSQHVQCQVKFTHRSIHSKLLLTLKWRVKCCEGATTCTHKRCLFAYGWTIGKMQVYWWRLQVSTFRTALGLFAHFDMLLWWR